MSLSRLVFGLVLGALAAGCGDNIRPETRTTDPRSATTSIGGSQVSRSKSFMLVTNVSTEHSAVAKSRSHTVKPTLGGQ